MRFLALFLLLLACSSTTCLAEHEWLTSHPVIQEMLQRTNAQRARAGLAPLVLDSQMCLSAQRHATYMCDIGMVHSGLPYLEAICQSQISAEHAINTWIASPPHHGILCSGSQVGFGYQNRNGRPSWVCVVR